MRTHTGQDVVIIGQTPAGGSTPTTVGSQYATNIAIAGSVAAGLAPLIVGAFFWGLRGALWGGLAGALIGYGTWLDSQNQPVAANTLPPAPTS